MRGNTPVAVGHDHVQLRTSRTVVRVRMMARDSTIREGRRRPLGTGRDARTRGVHRREAFRHECPGPGTEMALVVPGEPGRWTWWNKTVPDDGAICPPSCCRQASPLDMALGAAWTAIV